MDGNTASEDCGSMCALTDTHISVEGRCRQPACVHVHVHVCTCMHACMHACIDVGQMHACSHSCLGIQGDNEATKLSCEHKLVSQSFFKRHRGFYISKHQHSTPSFECLMLCVNVVILQYNEHVAEHCALKQKWFRTLKCTSS